MPNAGWITLDSCIIDYLNESESSNNRYFKLWHLGFRIMDEMGLDFFYQVQSIKLPLQANKTVLLPPNCMKWIKVGELSGNGEIYPLKYNTDLTNYRDLNPNRLNDVQGNSVVNLVTNTFSPSSPNYYNYWDGSGYTTLYGVNINSIYGGGFSVDEANGVILLDANSPFTEVILEYVASPTEGKEYVIPVQAREAMITGLAWMDIRNMPTSSHFNLGDKRDRMRTYYNQRSLAISRIKPFSLDQAYLQYQDNSRYVVKS